MGLKLKANRLQVRRATHYASPPLSFVMFFISKKLTFV